MDRKQFELTEDQLQQLYDACRPAPRVYHDGNAWCAVNPDFVDLQESPAGFGATPQEALANLKNARGA
jgi:hypothetical protein